MNLKSIISALAVFMFVALPLEARRDEPADDGSGAFLTALQERDSVLIGDQFKYGVRLRDVEDGTRLVPLPFDRDSVYSAIEQVGQWVRDTVKVRKDGKADIDAYVRVTSFDEGTHELPPVRIQVITPAGVVDTLSYESRFIEFLSMPVDTATFTVHDIKGQIRYPLTFAEILPYLGGALLLALLVVAAVFLFRRYRERKGDELLRKEPAHIVALRKLDKFRGEKYWADDKQKLFYSGVTDALREYIDSRYGIGAKEMTTAEIFDGMKGMDVPVELYEDMKALFERADFVKFAKMTVGREEIANELPSAVRFVTMTYQSELEEENKEE